MKCLGCSPVLLCDLQSCPRFLSGQLSCVERDSPRNQDSQGNQVERVLTRCMPWTWQLQLCASAMIQCFGIPIVKPRLVHHHNGSLCRQGVLSCLLISDEDVCRLHRLHCADCTVPTAQKLRMCADCTEAHP